MTAPSKKVTERAQLPVGFSLDARDARLPASLAPNASLEAKENSLLIRSLDTATLLFGLE